MVGEAGRAHEVVLQTLDRTRGTGTFHGRVLMTLGFLHWIAGNLGLVARTGASLLELAKTHELPETGTAGAYFQGIASYQLGELPRAESLLVCAAHARETPNSFFWSQANCALALAQQARGNPGAARETAGAFLGELLERGISAQVPVAQALVAELALRQGRHSEAVQWARTFEPGSPSFHYGIYVPELTLARALLAEGTSQSQDQASALLERQGEFFASIHNVRFAIEVRALQALAQDPRGEPAAAREHLAEAVRLAQPGGYVRLFVDLGPDIARLLNSLDLDEEGAAIRGARPGRLRRSRWPLTERGWPRARSGGSPRPRRAPLRAGDGDPGPPGQEADQQGDRLPALHLPGHGQASHGEHLPEARCPRSPPGGGRGPAPGDPPGELSFGQRSPGPRDCAVDVPFRHMGDRRGVL